MSIEWLQETQFAVAATTQNAYYLLDDNLSSPCYSQQL